MSTSVRKSAPTAANVGALGAPSAFGTLGTLAALAASAGLLIVGCDGKKAGLGADGDATTASTAAGSSGVGSGAGMGAGVSASSTSQANGSGASASATPSSSVSAPPRPGMVFIPPGELRAGTPRGKTPRIADEEMAGVPTQMGGYYIDIFSYPNEQGAIPTTNVARDEAARLCGEKGKRLCSELEWERACKGPDNLTYAYGDAYRAAACGSGVTAEVSAKRPSGERVSCKSAFGVMDLHGSSWEWTASDWNRGSRDGNDGALRGGNAVAGEIVDRCANGLARPVTTKAATIGFRCCAGDKNNATVDLVIESGPALEAVKIDPVAEAFGDLPPRAFDPEKLVEYSYVNALTWRPAANEPLSVLVGCTKGAPKKCGVFIGSQGTGKPQKVAAQSFGGSVPEVLPTGDRKVLKLRAVDWRGSFSRDISYSYGRVNVGPETRP